MGEWEERKARERAVVESGVVSNRYMILSGAANAMNLMQK